MEIETITIAFYMICVLCLSGIFILLTHIYDFTRKLHKIEKDRWQIEKAAILQRDMKADKIRHDAEAAAREHASRNARQLLKD